MSLTLVFPKRKLTSASIPVRWCVDAETFTTLSDTGLKPFILIKVHYERGYKPSFHLFPLDQYTAYLDIHYSGQITITGQLMVVEQNHKEAIHKLFMTDSYDRETAYPDTSYDVSISVRGDYTMLWVKTYDASDEYKFDIDDNLFGKELPEWLKFYVNRYWYINKPKDQCDQRRRLILFPFTTLLLLLVDFIGRTVWNLAVIIVGLLGGGYTGVKALLHPFDVGIMGKRDLEQATYIYQVLDRSKWMKDHGEPVLVYIFATSLIPGIYLTFYAIAMMANFTILEALYASLAIFWMVVIAIAASVGIVVGGRFLIYKVGGPAAERAGEWFRNKLDVFVGKTLDALDRFVDWWDNFWADDKEHQRELLLCHDVDGKCLPELSVRDKSFNIIFADIKNKVCKPMRG